MRKQYSVLYFVSQTFKGLFRNAVMTFASVAVLISMLVVMGGFWLLVQNIDKNLSDLEVLNDIIVMMDSSATDEEIAKTADALQDLKKNGIALNATTGEYEILRERPTSEVKNSKNYIDLEIDTITHVTKAQALEELKQSDPDLYSDITEDNNPLPDKFVLTYFNSEKVESISSAIWSINAILEKQAIKTVKGYEQLVNTISSVRNGVMYVFSWFLIILVIVSVFIIINTVKLSVYSRRQEIMIMSYVGATRWFITLPFIGEGLVIGAFSAIVAFFVEKFAYQGVLNLIESSDSSAALQIVSIMPFSDVKWLLLFGFLLLGMAAGVIGSCISLSKYAKH